MKPGWAVPVDEKQNGEVKGPAVLGRETNVAGVKVSSELDE